MTAAAKPALPQPEPALPQPEPLVNVITNGCGKKRIQGREYLLGRVLIVARALLEPASESHETGGEVHAESEQAVRGEGGGEEGVRADVVCEGAGAGDRAAVEATGPPPFLVRPIHQLYYWDYVIELNKNIVKLQRFC